jgi:O-antigen ligase
MLGRCATVLYSAALVTLPMAGVGVLKLVTGRDWGGGLQPSWVFLALSVCCLLIDKARKGSLGRDFSHALPDGLRRWWLWGLAGIFLALLGSVGGLWLAPAGESMAVVLGRFGKQVIQLLIMICFVIWPALWTRGSQRWTWTVKTLLIGGMIQFGYGILQGMDYFLGVPGYAWLDGVFTSNPSIFSGSGELYLGDGFRHVPRLRGMVCEPLYLGNYLLFLLPLTLVPCWSSRIRGLVGASLLVLLFGTWSRGAWLGLMAQVMLGAVLVFSLGGFAQARRSWKSWLLGAVVVLVVIPLVGAATGWESLGYPYRRLAQTFSGQDWSNLTRLFSMQAAWRAFLLSPVVGVGWGQFGWHFPLLVDPMGLQSQFTWPVVNNFPLQVLCETGLVGFLVFLGWVFGLGRAAVVRWLRVRRLVLKGGTLAWGHRVQAAALLGVFGVWSQLLTFSQYNLPHIWVALGLFLAALADADRGSEIPAEGQTGESRS